jgi:hypothetical protein
VGEHRQHQMAVAERVVVENQSIIFNDWHALMVAESRVMSFEC